MPTQKVQEKRPVPRPVKESRLRQEVAPENRIRRFWRETIAELRKVVWPTRDQAVNLTVIVVATVAAMSAFLGAIDYFLTQIVKLLLLR